MEKGNRKVKWNTEENGTCKITSCRNADLTKQLKCPTVAVSTKYASLFYPERSITKRTLHIRDC